VGSLGSAMADIWSREGWGRWTFIDPDDVAPHNLVRHISTSGAVGFPKAQCVRAHVAHSLGHDRKDASAICSRANDMTHSDVVAALENAALLVDASTTIEVPRDWSERPLPRSASLFFTHSGMSAVLLIEDHEQQIRLSALEAQYYRAIITEPWGEEHLQRPDELRVGAGCRDHSLVLSNELVKLHAAQLARRLRKATDYASAAIQVWTLNDATGGISVASVPVRHTNSIDCVGWSVRWDEGLRHKLGAMRKAGLPSETGGIVVGVIDQKLRTLTMVDASPAPADSHAEATGFIRGTEGSQDYVSRCARLTGGMVDYIGEWHSHPAGHSASPSTTDVVLLATLAERLEADGVPALMVIVSQSDLSVSLGESRRG
jgi:integrative and conjugative element protein (TIGR02256 family)